MSPSELGVSASCPKQVLVVDNTPPASGATEINRFKRKPEPNPPSTSTQEVIMEIAIAMAILVGIFAGIGALIMWAPYDR